MNPEVGNYSSSLAEARPPKDDRRVVVSFTGASALETSDRLIGTDRAVLLNGNANRDSKVTILSAVARSE